MADRKKYTLHGTTGSKWIYGATVQECVYNALVADFAWEKKMYFLYTNSFESDYNSFDQSFYVTKHTHFLFELENTATGVKFAIINPDGIDLSIFLTEVP